MSSTVTPHTGKAATNAGTTRTSQNSAVGDPGNGDNRIFLSKGSGIQGLALEISRDGDRLSALGYPMTEEPRAYVCVGDRCLAPVGVPEELDAQLASVAR